MIDAIRENWGVLGILPETRDVFLKRRAGLFRGYEPGDIFVQPGLAHALRRVASLGADYMYTGEWGRKFVDIVRDARGNVAAVCHTINADHWGNTGIFVDGVLIPGPGSEQQHRSGKIGPGEYLPDTTNPMLVLRNGRSVLASSSIGSDLHSATVPNPYNLLNFNMSLSASRATPKFQSIEYAGSFRQRVQNNQFSQSLLDAVQAMGLPIVLVNSSANELWIGLGLND